MRPLRVHSEHAEPGRPAPRRVPPLSKEQDPTPTPGWYRNSPISQPPSSSADLTSAPSARCPALPPSRANAPPPWFPPTAGRTLLFPAARGLQGSAPPDRSAAGDALCSWRIARPCRRPAARPASMCSVRLCSAGPARATSPLLSARSTRWGLRIIARHANACQARGRRGSHEWMLHRCGACDAAARLGNPWRGGAGAVKTCLDADVNRWSRCCRIAHTNRPELRVSRVKLRSVAHGQIALSAGKSRAADRLLHIIGRNT
jgi:hypothetical protein